MQRLLRYTGVTASLGMFIVLVMGALVTNTGSGHGCSNTWPLCNGKVIPQLSISLTQAASVEFSHRAVTAVETVLIVALAVGVWRLYRQRREARWLAPAMVVFLLLQAVLGAIAAGVHESAEVLALHFGVSLISFASIVLTTAFLFEARGGDAARDRPVPARLRPLILGTLVYTYVVVYLGAYVQHAGATVACRGWPLCNGSPVPGLGSPASYTVLVNVTHRFAAALLGLLVFSLWLGARRARAARPDLYRGAMAALVSVLLQTLSGAFLVFSHFGLTSELVHAALISLLFASLAYLAYHLIPRRVCLPRPALAVGGQPGRSSVASAR
jgi:cytochrome c oxidase assembly protein subunit 15